MISPTLIMETELETESESYSDDDDTVIIYEEILNNENYQHRQNVRRLSTTSSLYSSRGCNLVRIGPAMSYYHQVGTSSIGSFFGIHVSSFSI